MNNFCYCGVEQLLFTIAQEQLLFLIFTKLFMICPLAVLGVRIFRNINECFRRYNFQLLFTKSEPYIVRNHFVAENND